MGFVGFLMELPRSGSRFKQPVNGRHQRRPKPLDPEVSPLVQSEKERIQIEALALALAPGPPQSLNGISHRDTAGCEPVTPLPTCGPSCRLCWWIPLCEGLCEPSQASLCSRLMFLCVPLAWHQGEQESALGL